MFTSAATFADAPDSEQGKATVLDVLAPGGVRPGDLPSLTAAVNELLIDPTLQGMNASPTSSIPQLIGQITGGWQTLDVPVFLITCQLLLLAWLLLFLIATDAAEARAGEVALAKLRGHGRLRTLAFGLSEPVLLLAAGFLRRRARGLGGYRRADPDPAAARHAGRPACPGDRRRGGGHARRVRGDRARRPARTGAPGHRAVAANRPRRRGPGLGA